MEKIFHRYHRLVQAGCKPYPMVFDPIDDEPSGNDSTQVPPKSDTTRRSQDEEAALKLKNRRLRAFQRWVIGRYAEFLPWEQYWNEDSPPTEPNDRPDQLEDLLHQYRNG